MLTGPHVVHNPPTRRLEIADTTVTALHLLGLAIPEDMDGKVIADALDPELLAKCPVRFGPAVGDAGDDGTDEIWSAEEVEMVSDRLRGMGYLE